MPALTKNHFLRGFRRRLFFVYCNTIGTLLIVDKIVSSRR